MSLSFPLSRQLANSIEVLKKAIENANNEAWGYGEPPFYQIVFHTIYSLDMYFSTFNPKYKVLPEEYPLPDEFIPFKELGFYDKSIKEFQNPGEILTQDAMLTFLKDTKSRIRDYFSLDITSQFEDPSGFKWLRCNKFELIIHNIRHIMGHTGILNGYLKANNCEITGWIGGAEL